jgi:hypothetical protein
VTLGQLPTGSTSRERRSFSPEVPYGAIIAVLHGRKVAPPTSNDGARPSLPGLQLEVSYGATVAVLHGRKAAPPTSSDGVWPSLPGLNQPPVEVL